MKAAAIFVACTLLVASCMAQTPPPAMADNDVAILNFALNLEYLEANFYMCAATGKPLNSSMTGGSRLAVGCPGYPAPLSPKVMALAMAIAEDECKHVAFLRSALGSAAVVQPLLNIGNSVFNAAAKAAFATAKLTPQFSGYASDQLFLLSAFIFEDVGVTAYAGAAPLITNPTYLTAAAGILAVEGYHAGAIRATLLSMGAGMEAVFPYGVSIAAVSDAIATLRAAVDGVGMDDMGIMNMTTMAPIYVNADANSIAYGRLPGNVLPIVYLGGTTDGGFYPNGMNGVFTNAMTAPVNA